MIAAMPLRARIPVILVAVGICALSVIPCSAGSYGQSALDYFLPLKSIESVVGPIFPSCGLGSSFRSEFRAGAAATDFTGVKLIGANGMERDLREFSHLDQAPVRFDLAANLRCWRFAVRGLYTNFGVRSRHQSRATLDLSGLTVGGDFDVVQLEWLTVGARGDISFFEPRFQGRVRDFLPQPLADPLPADFSLDITGDKPITVGAYIRYVPPEILNFPLHIEAFGNVPLKGSNWTSFGISLVFRPQIYRFDLACKLRAEKSFLKFSTPPDHQSFPEINPIFPGLSRWRLELEWSNYGIDFAVFF